MIDLAVHISGGCRVNPSSWDTTAGLATEVKKAVEKTLSHFGHTVSVAVEVSL